MQTLVLERMLVKAAGKFGPSSERELETGFHGDEINTKI